MADVTISDLAGTLEWSAADLLANGNMFGAFDDGTDTGAAKTKNIGVAIAGAYNVRLFGAAGDGSTNDTSAINAAIQAAQSAGGGTVFFPAGVYKVVGTTNALLVDGDNVTLLGTGGGSIIAHASTTGDTLLIQKASNGQTRNENISIFGLQFRPSVTKTAGNEVSVLYAYNTRIQGLRFQGRAGGAQKIYRAMQLGSTNSPSGNSYYYRPVFGFVSNIYAEDVLHFLWMGNCTDWWFSQMSSWSVNVASSATGIIMDTNCQSVDFLNMDIIGPADGAGGSGAALKIQDTLGSGFIGKTAYDHFTNCYFDSYGYGLNASDSEAITFANCWFSDRPYNGINLASTTSGYVFNGCTVFNCGYHGVVIEGKDHAFIGGQVHAFGVSTADADGIVLGSSSDGTRVLGNRVSTGTNYQISSSGTRYGVNINASATNFIVKDNDARGPASGGVNDATSADDTRIVADNLGGTGGGGGPTDLLVEPFTHADGNINGVNGWVKVSTNSPQFASNACDLGASGDGATNSNTSGTDTTVEFDGTLTAGDGAIGVLIRSDAAFHNGYLVEFGHNSTTPYVHIWEITSDSFSLLENLNPSTGITIGVSTAFKVVASGTTITCYIGGVNVASTTDSAHTSGYVGLRAGGGSAPAGTAIVDNFHVTTP